MEQSKKIHLIAICGTGMGSLASLLVRAGHQVTGSDQAVYPPMSTYLAGLGIEVFEGYASLRTTPDLVIIGNAVSRDNLEVQAVLQNKIPYLSFPEALYSFFMKEKISLVVAGTHGKTTATALLAHCLKELGSKPSYLIGGILPGHADNAVQDTGPYFVVEGDEYDTAFFDKGPKFLHYHPHHAIITSMEFDHADIYRDLAHLQSSFEKLISIIDTRGSLLVCGHYPELLRIAREAKVGVESYGVRQSPLPLTPSHKGREDLGSGRANEKCLDWEAGELAFGGAMTGFSVFHHGEFVAKVSSPLMGEHNVLNALSVMALLCRLDFLPQDIAGAISTFMGVKRRQEIIYQHNDLMVMDDFAHHPTAVHETIKAVKARFPRHHLWAVFEPRSNSSKRDIFQDDYAKAFSLADSVVLADVFMPEKIRDGKILDIAQLTEALRAGGTDAHHVSGTEAIRDFLLDKVRAPAVILIMSNGGFGGLHQKLLASLVCIPPS